MLDADRRTFTIDCPYCESQGLSEKIPFEPQLLLQGTSFVCSSCKTQLTIKPSSIQTFGKGLNAYETYQKNTTELKAQGNEPVIR